MTLYDSWNQILENNADQNFWQNYLATEASIYEKFLAKNETAMKGSLTDLAKEYDVEPLVFVGFLDGINTSFTEELDLEALAEDTMIDAVVDFEKLYYNMLDAKAEWLYTIESWDTLLTDEQRKEIKKKHGSDKTFVAEKKIGRNDPCPCGSGKKYKKCCLNK